MGMPAIDSRQPAVSTATRIKVLEVEEASGGYGNWYDEALEVICGYGEWCEGDQLEASGGYGEAEGLAEVCIVRAGVNS